MQWAKFLVGKLSRNENFYILAAKRLVGSSSHISGAIWSFRSSKIHFFAPVRLGGGNLPHAPTKCWGSCPPHPQDQAETG